MKPVCIMGLGYIGLPTAVVAAQNNIPVIGYDIDAHKVSRINAGDPVIIEPTLQEQLQTVVANNLFSATTVLPSAEVYIIAVPTPCTAEKKADLSCVFAALETICSVIQSGITIIIESTIPAGTTERCAAFICEKTGLQPGLDFFIAHCPERVLPGNIFKELITNARIIGGITQESAQRAAHFYKKFVHGELYITTATTAEMVKLIENSYRDTALAFANQVAAMADAANISPHEVIELANQHPRVSILQPGCGVGGHCIAIDPWFLIESFPEQTQLLQTARSINDGKPHQVIAKVQAACKKFEQQTQRKPVVGVLGLTDKPNIDDLRESPALYIAQQLEKTVNLRVCEPHVEPSIIQQHISAQRVSFAAIVQEADIIVCLVKHDNFCKEYIKKSNKLILDMCGLTYDRNPQSSGQEQSYWPVHQAHNHATKEHC